MSRWLRQTITRALAFVLVVMVAVGAAMPAWARLVAEPAAHACHCEVRGGHAHCACPICFPELRDDDVFSEGLPSASGKCGDDDPGWRTLACAAVPASTFVVSPPLARIARLDAPRLSPSQWRPTPEGPPPRARLSATL